MGVTLTQFFVENISLPPEVEEALDKRARWRCSATSTSTRSSRRPRRSGTRPKNPGGMAGLGAGLGAGVAVGQQMGGAAGSAAAFSARRRRQRCRRCSAAAADRGRLPRRHRRRRGRAVRHGRAGGAGRERASSRARRWCGRPAWPAGSRPRRCPNCNRSSPTCRRRYPGISTKSEAEIRKKTRRSVFARTVRISTFVFGFPTMPDESTAHTDPHRSAPVEKEPSLTKAPPKAASCSRARTAARRSSSTRASRSLKCPYCGHETEGRGHRRGEVAGARLRRVRRPSWRRGASARIAGRSTQIRCTGCGAMVLLEDKVVTDKCPFCGTHLENKPEAVEGMIPPESLIPFKRRSARRPRGVRRSGSQGLWFAPDANSRSSPTSANSPASTSRTGRTTR